MEWTQGFCKELLPNCSWARRILFLMWACICSAIYYGLLLWLLLHCALLPLAQLFRNHKCGAGHEHENTWKTARPAQVSDVTHSKNIDAVSCKTKFKNLHWCLSIKEPKQNLVTEIMLKAWGYLRKPEFLVAFIATLENVLLCICLSVFCLGQKQPSDIFKTHIVELIICPVSVTDSNYGSNYTLMFRSRVTHGDQTDSHQFL